MLTKVEPGMVATIVTSLQLCERPRPRILPETEFRLVRWRAPGVDRYRALFRRVGEPWLWFSRLVMADADLSAILRNEKVEIYAVEDRRGIEIGMLELDFRTADVTEISLFGFVPELTSKGHGAWLMTQALSIGWRKYSRAMRVHTCTLDHPAALRFYRRYGFVPFETAVETFADPRLAGILPRDAAPHVPMVE